MFSVRLASACLAIAPLIAGTMAQCEESPQMLKWDTHVHLFEPERFPLSDGRAYTPMAATPVELLASSPGKSFLLVQASVENGTDALLAHMVDLQSNLTYGNVVRGEIIYGEDSNYTKTELDAFHNAGVRVLRGYARFASDTEATAKEMKRLLEGRMGEIAREYGWIVSFQLSPAVWTMLEDFRWKEKLAGIPVIAEHLGSVNVPLDSESERGLQSLIRLMKDDMLTVKINALHRRGLYGNEEIMEQVIKQLIAAGPQRLIWGSDWPHVNSSASGLTPSNFLPVNETAELEWLKGFMSGDVFSDMLYATPSKLLF